MRRTPVAALLVLLCLNVVLSANNFTTLPQHFGMPFMSSDGSVLVCSVDDNQYEGDPVQIARWTAATGWSYLAPWPTGWHNSMATSADGSAVAWDGDYRYWSTQTGAISLLSKPASPATVRAISADGSVVVGDHYGFDSLGGVYRWTRSGGVTPLGCFGDSASLSFVRDVSADANVIVGVGRVGYYNRATRWTQQTGMTDLGVLSGYDHSSADYVSRDGGTVVGTCSTTTAEEVFRWTQDGGMVELGMLPGYSKYDLEGISADGSVVVGIAMGTGSQQVFRWTPEGGMVALAESPWIGGVSATADGSVIAFTDASGQGFIWDGNNGSRNIADVLTALGATGIADFPIMRELSISADGSTLAGWGFGPGLITYGAWVAPLPEPSSLAALLLGALALARKRSRHIP